MALKTTTDEISYQNTEKSSWVIVNGCVFDITSFLSKHPGGKDILLQHAGQDITLLMSQDVFHKHSEMSYSLLSSYKIGDVKEMKDEMIETLNTSGWKEETVDWKRGLVCQVHKFGHDYIHWVHSPVEKKLRLFETDFLEFFSKTPWYAVPMIWLPVTLCIAYAAFINLNNTAFGESICSFHTLLMQLVLISLMFCGIILWTIVEYLLHRFVFHFNPPGDSVFWTTVHFFLHGQHHKVPFDQGRLVFPPAAASVIALFFYFFFVSVFPIGIGQGLFAGGVLGYILYDMTHYYLHHGHPSKGSYFHRLKQCHMQHHFVDQKKGFGISSRLWDGPFGTLLLKRE